MGICCTVSPTIEFGNKFHKVFDHFFFCIELTRTHQSSVQNAHLASETSKTVVGAKGPSSANRKVAGTLDDYTSACCVEGADEVAASCLAGLEQQPSFLFYTGHSIKQLDGDFLKQTPQHQYSYSPQTLCSLQLSKKHESISYTSGYFITAFLGFLIGCYPYTCISFLCFLDQTKEIICQIRGIGAVESWYSTPIYSP